MSDLPTITDEREILIETPDMVIDSLGRRRFSAYWLDSNVGAGGDETGTRGQCFYGNLGEFVARQQQMGMRVAFI